MRALISRWKQSSLKKALLNALGKQLPSPSVLTAISSEGPSIGISSCPTLSIVSESLEKNAFILFYSGGIHSFNWHAN